MTSLILVTGGTGTVGRHVVPRLRDADRDVRVISRHSHSPGDGVEVVTGDLATGEGIEGAVAGAGTVVHLAGGAKGDGDKARTLVREASRACVRQLVYISVVGADRVPIVSGIGRHSRCHSSPDAVLGPDVICDLVPFMRARYRLADVVGSLSVIADLGFGLPPQQAVRSSLIATALARRLGVDNEDLRAAFYVPLLMHIGCISMSHETAALFGNEIAITRAVAMTNLGDPRDIAATLIPEATRGLGESAREETTAAIVTHAPTFGNQYDTASSEVARQTARRIRLPENVQRGLYEVAEAWEGGGAPAGLKGAEIALAARITRLASDAAFFDHIGSTALAIEAIRARAGTLHDPSLAKEFIEHAPEVLTDARSDEPQPLLLQNEPAPAIEIDGMQMIEVCAAFGDAADLKTPYTHGASKATAEVAAAAGERLALERDVIDELRMASYLHDVGRVAISNAVWEKTGPLNSIDWEQVRMHAHHAERIVIRSSQLQTLARPIGMHHERMDGSGYHRGSRSAEIPFTARIVAVADAWVSMQQRRPHREALDPDRAAAELEAGSTNRAFDPQVVAGVLEAAGRAAPLRRVLPGGLSTREVDVLRLVAAGYSNPEIAEQLHISRRTAEHHVQHIYTKIGVSTRPGAAMFALEHNLLEPLVS